MTEASERALHGLRDFTTLQWYAVPLLALVFYVYTIEIKKARQSGDWDAIFAGLTLFGMDFLNETWNGWVLHLSERSALWTAPGPTALRTMIGWNIEIMFMFAISGIVFYHTLADPHPAGLRPAEPRGARILGLPDRWFWAITYSAFCVLVELCLNAGGLLVWEYRYWNRTLEGIFPIFFLGYFIFYVAVILVIGMRTNRAKVAAVAGIYGLGIAANAVAMGVLGWRY